MCIFCKIVKGEIPCKKIYEDENNLAFLDIFPRTEGHSLVISKKHYMTLDEMPAEELKSFIIAVQNVIKLLKDKLTAPAYNIVSNNGSLSGQEVPHIHFHILPKTGHDKFHLHFPPVSEESKAKLNQTYEDISED